MLATVQPTTTWTILSLIEWGARYLNERGFEDSRLNVELLLSHTLHLKRIDLYTSFDRPLTASELGAFKKAFRRRLDHEPLQYITGETEFMGIPLYVDRSVLIPRPETEELVQRALDRINQIGRDRVEILDIGTGSGNIPIAIEHFAPKAHITSIDVSEEALAVATRNVQRNQCTRVIMKRQDVFDSTFFGGPFDVVISNPPYISAKEFVTLQPEVREFEPSIATTDCADGLKFVKRICAVAKKVLTPGGMLFLEIAYTQGNDARRIAEDAGLIDVGVFRDIAGNERILQGQLAI